MGNIALPGRLPLTSNASKIAAVDLSSGSQFICCIIISSSLEQLESHFFHALSKDINSGIRLYI